VKRVRREVERARDRTRGHAFGSGLHKQPEHIEPVVLRERRQRRHDLQFLRVSVNIEMPNGAQALFQ